MFWFRDQTVKSKELLKFKNKKIYISALLLMGFIYDGEGMYKSNQVLGEQFSFTCVQVYFDKLLTSHYSNRDKYISFSWAPFNHLSLWAAKTHLSLFQAAAHFPWCTLKSLKRVRNPGRLLLSPCPSSWTETGFRALVRNAKTWLSAQPSCQPQWVTSGFSGLAAHPSVKFS